MMRTAILALTLTLAGPAMAQTAPAGAPAAATARLTLESPIETIMADPAGKAIIARHLPNLATHPAYESIEGMSLKDIQPLSGDAITDAMLAGVDTDLKALPPVK